MEPNIHSVAIITKRDSSEADSAAIKVATLLNRSKIKVHSVAPFIIKDATPIRPDQLKDMKLDLVFAIGGDGTTLRAFRTIPRKVPLFSINSGGHRASCLKSTQTQSTKPSKQYLQAGIFMTVA